MRTLDSGIISALASGRIVERRLITLTLADLDDGDPYVVSFWTGDEIASFNVIDGLTGSTDTRSFNPGLVAIDAIRLETGLSVREVTATFKANQAAVETAFRGKRTKFAPAQIYRAMLDKSSGLLIAAAPCRFAGFIDQAENTVPAEGGNGLWKATLVSLTRELTRGNPRVRSYDDQHIRNSGDHFFKFAGSAPDWEIFWGKTKPKTAR